MFGYIKPQKEELLLKDYNLYRAVYCGLCREIKKNVSFFLSFSLSYDFVFLAIARDMISSGKAEITTGRCPYNPLKKKIFASSEGIKFASLASLLLIEKNIEDKMADGDMKHLSLFLLIAKRYLKGKIKKLSRRPSFNSLREELDKRLDDFSTLENKGVCVDTLCEAFGSVMSCVMASGFSGNEKKIAEALGASVGAWLYLADAIDDCEKDYKKGHFNPLLSEYKTPCEVKKRVREFDVALAMHTKDAHLALSLCENSIYSRIAENIVTKGMGLEAYRLFTGGKNDRSV